MGLTKRQAQAVEQIVIEESRAAHRSQQERHRILSEVDGEDVVLASRVPELPSSVKNAIVDLIEAFYHNNRVYEGAEFDGGRAAKRATEYLYHLIEADVKETRQMLQEGDFEMDQGMYGMDQMDMGGDMGGGLDQEAMPSGGGSSAPPPSGMDQDDEISLPPMHPRGREEKVTMKPGQVSVGGPGKVPGMRDSLPEPKRGYGGGGESADLPPMHPRGRR